jgi:hypothetical protein
MRRVPTVAGVHMERDVIELALRLYRDYVAVIVYSIRLLSYKDLLLNRVIKA